MAGLRPRWVTSLKRKPGNGRISPRSAPGRNAGSRSHTPGTLKTLQPYTVLPPFRDPYGHPSESGLNLRPTRGSMEPSTYQGAPVQTTTIGYAQIRPRFGDREANHATIRRMAELGKHADLLVFPELCTSGYDFRDREELASLAEPFKTGPSSQLAKELAIQRRATIVIGYPEDAGDLFFNSCVLAMPDGGMANYRKLHLFSRESRIFAPGDGPPPVIDTPAGRVGLMICLDWLFPEAARVLALAGAQVIAHPSNLVMPHCQKAMVTRSLENGVFSITANRIGTESRTDRSLTFTGASQVIGPRGQRLISAPTDEEHLGLVEIDPATADDKMITEENHLLNDIRVCCEYYGKEGE